MEDWRNWQTQGIQNPSVEIPYRFKSGIFHHFVPKSTHGALANPTVQLSGQRGSTPQDTEGLAGAKEYGTMKVRQVEVITALTYIIPRFWWGES